MSEERKPCPFCGGKSCCKEYVDRAIKRDMAAKENHSQFMKSQAKLSQKDSEIRELKEKLEITETDLKAYLFDAEKRCKELKELAGELLERMKLINGDPYETCVKDLETCHNHSLIFKAEKILGGLK